MPATREPESSPPPSEAERVRASVELRFLNLGFDIPASRALAASDVDWHEAERLIVAGCPHRTALEILL